MQKLWKFVTAYIAKHEGEHGGPVIVPNFCFNHIIQNIQVRVGRTLDTQRPGFCVAKNFAQSSYASAFYDAIWMWLSLRLEVVHAVRPEYDVLFGSLGVLPR